MKITTLLAPCIIVGLFITPDLSATEESPWNASLLTSYLNPDDDRRIATEDDDIGFAAALGYQFTPKFEGRFIYNKWDLGSSAKGYGLDALFHFNDEQLYGIAGYKRADFDRPSEDLLNLGLGKRFAFNDKLFFTAEALIYQSLEQNHTDWGANMGLTYMFGKTSSAHKPKPAPVADVKPVKSNQPKDSDGDGVMDADDNCPNTPMADAVDGQGCSRYKMAEETIRLSINFATNSDVVENNYHGEIAAVAKFMNKYPDATVVIEGHTSAKGDALYNQDLSERRAKMVAKILIKQYGISNSRVTHVGYGEERLLTHGNSKADHQKNRRIEARISGSKRVKVQRY